MAGSAGSGSGSRSPAKQVTRLEPALGPDMQQLIGSGDAGAMGRLVSELEKERQARHDVERELSICRHRLHEMQAMRVSTTGESLGVGIAPML